MSAPDGPLAPAAGAAQDTHPAQDHPPAQDAPGAAGRRHWLVKSEPDCFSWAQQVGRAVEPWTGVRNHQARAHLAAMRLGDLAFFYHSNIGREIVGVVEVVREAYPDPTAESGPWVCVDVRALHPLPRPVGLAAIRAEPALAAMALLRQSRLSVSPVTPGEWRRLCELGGCPS